MSSHADWPTFGSLDRKLQAISEGMRPGSRAMGNLRKQVYDAVLKDHQQKMLRGLDRKERPLAKLAASTLEDKRRPAGGPLMPGGTRSRFYTNFVLVWSSTGGSMTLIARYTGMPWAKYHRTGCPKGSNKKRPNWSLPQRDVDGVTLAGRDAVRAICRQHLKDVASGKAQ